MSYEERKSAVNTFKKGDIVTHGTTTVLVTGEGASHELFAGVVVKQTDKGNIGKVHAVGDYGRTWHSWKFKMVIGATEYATKIHLQEEESKQLIKTLLEVEQGKRDALQARCDKMEAALLSAQRLKALWAFSEPVSPEHLNEAVALEYMANKIDEALAFKPEGINEKEGCPYCGIENCQSDHK